MPGTGEEIVRKRTFFRLCRARKGIEQGIYQTLTEILNHRLGARPSDVEQRLRTCTLVNPALDAVTWDEFVAALPA